MIIQGFTLFPGRPTLLEIPPGGFARHHAQFEHAILHRRIGRSGRNAPSRRPSWPGPGCAGNFNARFWGAVGRES